MVSGSSVKHVFTVEIDIEDLATFIPINNTFCKTASHNWPTEAPYWNGVLIQLGEFETHGDEQQVRDTLTRHIDRRRMNVFNDDKDDPGAVVFKKGDEPKPKHILSRDEIKSHTYWINVFPKNPLKLCLKRESLPSLPHEGSPRPLPMSVSDLGELGLLDPVTPLRSFSHPFRGGITLWHDLGQGFDLEARMIAHKYDPEAPEGSHNKYTFRLTGEPYSVEIYQNGVKIRDANDLAGVDKIWVRTDKQTADGHGHGKHRTGQGGGE